MALRRAPGAAHRRPSTRPRCSARCRVPVVLLDPNDRFRYANQAAEQFLGISLPSSRSCGWSALVPEDNPLFR